MLNITSTGSIAQMIQSVRDVPAHIVPYAASTALTRTAKHAEAKDLPDEMRRVFSSPTPYALKSLFVQPSTAKTLSARVMVKNTAVSGVVPEKFLQPEVDGGGRGAKGLERGLRYAGVLRSGQFAVPGAGMALDAHGNVKGADVRSILIALKNTRAASNAQVYGQKLRKGRKLANSLFVGKPKGASRPDGIWRREGQRLRPLFIFTSQAPSYGKRLDFSGVVQRVAQDRFRDEFALALDAMLKKGQP